MSLRWAIAWALVLGSSVGGARAQEAAAPPSATDPATSRQEVQRRLRLLRAWEITRRLKLDGQTAGKILAVFARTDDRRQTLRRDLSTAWRELRKLLRQRSPDPAALQGHIDAFVQKRLELAKLKNDEFGELRSILSPVQQAKYLLAERDFQKKIRKMLGKVRKK
jgi:Spy/CpxP family protein refolding chaperone